MRAYYIPIVKSLKKSGDDWILEGIASTPDVDLQGDIIPLESFDLSYFLRKKPITGDVTKHNIDHPWVDYDHGYELSASDNKQLIIGEPLAAKITPEGLWVRLKIYKNELGRALRRNMESFAEWGWPRRYGLSISGLAARDPNNPARIRRFIPLSVAVTPRPVNPAAYTEIVKGRALREDRIMGALEEYERGWKSLTAVVADWELTSGEWRLLEPLVERREKALTTLSTSGASIRVQDLEGVLHRLSWHLRSWKHLHPECPHLTWDGYFDGLDQAREHFVHCEHLVYRDVAEVLGMLRGSALLNAGQANLL